MLTRTIHVTATNSFRQCRRRYYYQEVQHLVPLVPNPKMALGIAFHQGVSVYYRTGDWDAGRGAAYLEWLKQIVSEEGYDEEGALLASMYNMYVDDCRLHDPEAFSRLLGVELPISAPIISEHVRPMILRGTLDLLVSDVHNRLWIVDHKTVAAFRDPNELILDDQMAAYAWLVRQAYPEERLAGVIYSQVRRKLPSIPEVVSDGTRLSRRACDTTPEVYRRAIKSYGLDPRDYQEELTQLENSRDRWVRREWIPIGRSRIDTFATSLAAIAADIDRAHARDEFYPTPTPRCSVECPFSTLCRIEAEGGDITEAVEGMFRIDPHRRERVGGTL